MQALCRQTFMFSATMPPAVERITRKVFVWQQETQLACVSERDQSLWVSLCSNHYLCLHA